MPLFGSVRPSQFEPEERRISLGFGWGITIVTAIIFGSIALLASPRDRMPATVLALLIVVPLGVTAAVRTIDASRFGETSLILDAPIAVGGRCSGRIETELRAMPSSPFRVRLTVEPADSGQIQFDLTEPVTMATPTANGIVIPFAFAIPAGQPATGHVIGHGDARSGAVWRVHVYGQYGFLPFRRRYQVPVAPAAE